MALFPCGKRLPACLLACIPVVQLCERLLVWRCRLGGNIRTYWCPTVLAVRIPLCTWLYDIIECTMDARKYIHTRTRSKNARSAYLWSTDRNLPSIVCLDVKHGGLTMSDNSEVDARLLIIRPTATKHDILFADSESAPTPLPSLSSPCSILLPDESSHSFICVQGFK